MAFVELKITGTKEEINKFHSLGEKLTNFSTAMMRIGDELKSYYSGQVFASEGGAIGQRWAKLSPVYASWKGKHYPGRGILIATGEMQQSFESHATPISVEISNSSNHFKYNQLGTRRMPARPMLTIDDHVKDIVEHVINNDIKEKISSM